MQTWSNRHEEKHKNAKFEKHLKLSVFTIFLNPLIVTKFEKHLKLSMFTIFHTPLIVANRGGLPSAQEGAVGVWVCVSGGPRVLPPRVRHWGVSPLPETALPVLTQFWPISTDTGSTHKVDETGQCSVTHEINGTQQVNETRQC